MGSFTWAASDWTPSEKNQRQVEIPLRTLPQRAPTKWDGRQRSPCLTHLMEERSLRGGQPNIQHAAVRHAEHLEGCPFKAVHIFTVLVGDCEDSVGEALAGGVHLCGVTLEVVRDLGPGDVKCLEDDPQRLWAVARSRYERACLHGASLLRSNGGHRTGLSWPCRSCRLRSSFSPDRSSAGAGRCAVAPPDSTHTMP